MEGARKNMRYPVEETAAKHERIVKKASRLFRERGLENVSVAEVMKDAGLTLGMHISIRRKSCPNSRLSHSSPLALDLPLP